MRKWFLGVAIVFVAETLLFLAYSVEAKAQVCQIQCQRLRGLCLGNCNQDAEPAPKQRAPKPRRSGNR
jgi:hypothetical protein